MRFVVALFALCLIGAAVSCPVCSPCVLTKAYTPEVYSGVLTCCGSCTGNPLCDAAGCTSCFKDTSNACTTCEQKSPVCSCMKSLGESCGCGCDSAKTFVYFPEVQYPQTIIEMNPFYYSTCFSP